MTKIIPLTNLAKGGVISDQMAWDLSGDYVTDLNNVRVSSGKFERLGGYETVVALPGSFTVDYLMYANTSGGKYWILPGEDKVYAYNGSSFDDISSGAYAGSNAGYWQGCMLGGIPILNNKNHTPEYWQPQSFGTNLQALPWDAGNTWAAVSESCTIMRAHKQFLFAMDLVSGGTAYPDSVRWSSPADVGSVPATWDETDTTNVAGLVPLGADGGAIIDGKSLRDAFVVYREKGIAVFDYVGGRYVWQIRQMDTATGVIAKESIIEVNGVHYFIGDGDIYFNDGNKVDSLMYGKIRDRFRADYNSEYYFNAFAVRNDAAREAWFFIPTSTSEHPNKVYVYNWKENQWTWRDIPVCISAGYGKKNAIVDTWDSGASTSWDGDSMAWDTETPTPLNDALYAVTASDLIMLDDLDLASEVSYESFIERTGLAISGISHTNTINRVYPHMEGPGSVYIQLGSQDYPGAAVRWKERELFNPNTDRSITTRTTGELHCFRITSADDLPWEFSGMDISVVEAGRR